jgi:hypothetical protein
VGSHVREAKPSAPPRRYDRTPVRAIRAAAARRQSGLFKGEMPVCPCGSRDGLRWVTEERTEQDEEGGYRQVTTCAWRCHACRQRRMPW